MKFARNILPAQPIEALARTLTNLGVPFLNSSTYEAMTVRNLDLERFMGPWRVQGHTPLVIDDNSSNQIETYSLNASGGIDVTYQFTRFGKEFTMHPEAEVLDKDTNAHWKMKFFKVLPADYLIVRLAEDYSYTAVSVPGKRLVWVMSREAKMPEEQYAKILEDLEKDGYNVKSMRRVPQDI